MEGNEGIRFISSSIKLTPFPSSQTPTSNIIKTSRNQKPKILLKRGKTNSAIGISWSDPWVESSIVVQMSRTGGNPVFDNQLDNCTIIIERVTAGFEFARRFWPKLRATAGLICKHAGASDQTGSPLVQDAYRSPITASGDTHDNMLLAKVETVYSASGFSKLVFNIEQGLPVMPGWLCFNRISVCARKAMTLGPCCIHLSLSGGHVVGNFPPHEAFAIGGVGSVRGYGDGAVGSGRSYVVGNGELLCRLFGPVKGMLFADYGSDLGSGSMVPGDPAGARLKPGRGYCCGVIVYVNLPLVPRHLACVINDRRTGRFFF